MTTLHGIVFVNELNNAKVQVQDFFNNCFEWLRLAWQRVSLTS